MGRVKKALETAATLKGTGATADEAKQAAGWYRSVASDPESSLDTRDGDYLSA